jgi:type II secretory pathway component PulM
MSMAGLFARVPWPPVLVRAWDGASTRERLLVAGASMVVVAALLWVFAWQPITVDVVRMQRELAHERVTLARARAQADELAGLPGATGAAPGTDARTAVDRIIGERGLKPLLTSLDVQDGRVRVTFAAIRFDALIGALEALAKDGGLRPLAMTLTPRVEPGSLRAEVTLGR